MGSWGQHPKFEQLSICSECKLVGVEVPNFQKLKEENPQTDDRGEPTPI